MGPLELLFVETRKGDEKSVANFDNFWPKLEILAITDLHRKKFLYWHLSIFANYKSWNLGTFTAVVIIIKGLPFLVTK